MLSASGYLGVFRRSFRGLPLDIFFLMFLEVITVPRISHEHGSEPMYYSFRLTESLFLRLSAEISVVQ